MLTIVVPGGKFWDEEIEKFLNVEETVLELEHSLVSLSKWESEFEKPFLSEAERTNEELLGYIRAMTLNPGVHPNVYLGLTEANLEEINDYISKKFTATWFRKEPNSPNREIITAELIYYWMMSLNIPLECENWHLNRLFTLIRVFNAKNSKPKPMSAHDRRALNEARKKQYQTSG